MNYPPDDSPETWHVHDDDDGENESWGWGVECGVCAVERRPPAGAPMFNISTLQRQNREGSTTASEERDALGDRWNDPKVGRA